MRAQWLVAPVAAVVLAGCGTAPVEQQADQAGPVPVVSAPSDVEPPPGDDRVPSGPAPGAAADPAAVDGVAAAAPRITTTDLSPAPIGAGTAPIEASRAVRVSVASVGIDAPLVDLGLDPAGAVAAPEDFDTAGWYEGSAQPGQPGPAVLAGHVDSRSGPAAFHRLGEVAVGDAVTVHREDGTTVTFRVTATAQYAKESVPTQEIYGPTTGPQLRLITCGGEFDRADGHYEDNVVVYATI